MQPWPGDQPRHRVLGADRARVGQADRGAGEVVDGQLAGPGLADHVLVGHPELAEVHGLGGLDVGHEQLPGPVVLAHVDGQAEVDVLGLDQHRLAVLLGVGVVHLRRPGQRPDHRVADEVGERHLAAAAPAEVVVDHYAVVDQQLGRDGAHAGGGRHGEAGGHVGRGAGGRPAQPDLDRVPARRGGGGGAGRWPVPGESTRPGPGAPRCAGAAGAVAAGRRPRAVLPGLVARAGCCRAWSRGRRPRPAWRGRDGRGAAGAAWPGGGRGRSGRRRRGGAGLLRRLRVVVSEEIPPGPVHRAGIRLVALVELVHEPLVGPEVGARRIGSSRSPAGGPRLPFAGAVQIRDHSGTQQTRRTSPSSEHWILCHFRTPGYPAGVSGAAACQTGGAEPGPVTPERRSLPCGSSQLTYGPLGTIRDGLTQLCV